MQHTLTDVIDSFLSCGDVASETEIDRSHIRKWTIQLNNRRQVKRDKNKRTEAKLVLGTGLLN